MRRHPPAALLGLLLLTAGCQPGADPAPPPPVVPAARTDRPLRVWFLDIGQGDAALIQVPGGVSLLVDGGPPEAGTRVLEALRAAGIGRVEWIIGSHPHSDHIGGLLDVLRKIPAERALDPGYNHGTATQRSYLQLLKQKGVRTHRARAGQSYELGSGARLEVLAPREPLLSGTQSDANNNSIVARLVYGETRFLFTGDMETEQRERLLEAAPENGLRAQVLKVAHHGSHNGTDLAFLRRVRPDYAVISCEAGNEYGHPHREALSALRRQNVRVLRTDQEGTIRFISDGARVTLAGAPASPGVPGGELPGPTPATEAAAPADAPATPVTGPVIGNRSSRVFHAPDCPSLPGSGNRVQLKSAAHAERTGYRRHNACLPEKPEGER